MAAYNEESVQWLYDKMQGDGVDTGTIDDFKESLKNDADRDWYYNHATKKLHLNVGTPDEFRSLTVGNDEVEEPQQAGGTVVDQAVDNMNRMTGHMPQDVQDVAFRPQANNQPHVEVNNPQMFQKPAVDPEPWKAEGLTKEQYEDIAWMRGVNRSTPLAVDEEGQVWSNAEVATGQREQKTERTYQTKESWDDTYSRKANRYGQLRYGWRRGQRFRQLDTDGEHLAGYVAQTDPDTAAAAEQMSDQQLIEAYNKLSKQINRGYTGGIWGFSKTPEGQVLGAQLSAIGKELHFRDLGYEHTSSVPGRGDVDYRSIMTEPDVAEEAKRLSSTGDRDAEVARLYQEGMTSGNMEAAERAMLASAALYCKERNIDIDTAYAMVEADAFNTAMRAPLQADVDKIYQEEKDVQSQKKTEAISGMRHPQSAGGAMHQELAMRRAAPTGKMLNTMARRAINESAASRAYYNMRLREYMRGGSMDIMHARAAAMNDVRNLFRDIEVAKATPDSSWGIVANAFVMENMPVQAIRGLANLATGDYESDMIIDEGMARAKANASVATNILAGVAPFVADSALGSFKIPGLVGKGVSTGLTKLTTWSLNRTLGLGEEVVMRRLGGSWVYRTVTGALSGSANFGTYMGMSAAVQGFRQGNASLEGTWEGAKHGLWDGLIFGGVNGSMSKIVESAKGGWAIAAEAGALTTEAGVFTALDYMRTGEITAESIGQSLGMVLASRAMNFKGWASDVAARVNGTKWQHQVKGQVKWSKETRDELQEKYPTLCRLMGGDNLALDLVKGLRTNEYKYNEKGEVDNVATANAIEREWAAMVEDPTVDFAAKRMANYVLNGQIVPTPAVCNWRITEPGEDGISYGETIDINGQVIERFKLKNDDERRRFEQGVALDAERNRIGLEQTAWGSRELEPVIVDAIDAVASAHGLDRDELAKAYFTEDRKIRGTVMKAAVKEAEALVIAEMRTKTNPQEAVEKKYGVDLEEVRKTPIKDRTEAEQQALDEYELRLTDRYDESQDKSTAELIAEEQQQSHDDGYKAEGDQRADLKEQLEDAANALTEMRIDPRQFDGMTEEQIGNWLESRGNNEEEIDAVLDYLNAKAAFEGVKDKVQDVATDRIEQVNKETDSQTNKVTGQIHRVTVKPEDENNPGREAVVVDGKITIDEKGDVDRENSDKTIVVKYADQEEPVIIPIEDVLSGEQPLDPENVKQESADAITQEEVGRAVDEMNRTLAFNEGDTVTVLAEGRPVELTVVGRDPENGFPILQDSKGNRAAMHPDIVQEMHDQWREWEKNGRPQQEQPVAPTERTETPVEGQQPLDRLERAREALADKGFDVVIYDEAPVEYLEQKILPSDVVSEELKDVVREYIDARKEAERDEAPAIEDGSVAMPTPGEGDPQEMLDYFRDAGWSDTVADKTITNSIIQAAERLEKAQRELEESKETDPQKLAELEAMVNAEQRELDYWNEVGRRKWGNAEQPAAPVAENEMQPVEEPTADNGGTESQAAEPVEEYDGPGMSPELRERMDDGTGVVGLVDEIARQLGLQVREFDGPSYMPGYIEDGTIWINRNRNENSRDTYRFTLGHELTHGLKQEAERLGRPDLYEALRDAALKVVKMREGSGFEAYVRGLTRRYQNAHYQDGYNKAIAAGMSEADAIKAGNEQAARVSREFIDEEMVCDVMGGLISGDASEARRMFEQVENKTLMQQIKDWFVGLLQKIRNGFPADSKEYTDIDAAIDRFNEMYNEVLGERAKIQEGLGDVISDGEGHSVGSRASVSADFEGMGFKFFSDHLGEDGKRQAMEDKDGNVYVLLGDRKFDKDNHITAEDIAGIDSALNYMLKDGLAKGRITPIQEYRIQSNYAKMLNMFLDLGAGEKGGAANLESNYQMLAETVFRTVSTNGDKQYGVSVDITRVCKKNEAVINTISQLQLEQGYGATPAQILDIYLATHEEGYQVPCPVCYVFSRYIRNGKFASSAINGMEMYGQHLPGGSDPWSVERWVEELGKLGGLKDVEAEEGVQLFEDMSKVANDAITRNLTMIDNLGARLATELNKEKPNQKTIRQLENDIRKLSDEYKAACDYFGQMSQTNWIKNFAIRNVNGEWRMWEDARLPEDMERFKANALDLRRTAETIEDYPAIQRLRKSGGSASGKEIHQESNCEIGECVMGIGQKGAPRYRNYYMEAQNESDPIKRQDLLDEAAKVFDKAAEFAAKQNLRGGQRMWSWSDNIERLSPDVISNLMQLEILGAGLQSYSKQLEGVEMVARMNGYVNGSLMAKDDGYREVTIDDTYQDENGVLRLKDDIMDTVYDTWHKRDRDRVIAGKGAMVHEVNGKYYVLIYDDVIGIDPFGADGMTGLFELNKKYNRAGNILVTMNDLHSKLALADDNVHFIIPWHSSGANQHILAQMFNLLGQDIGVKSVDYTSMQEEKDYGKANKKTGEMPKIPAHLHEVWSKAREYAEARGWTSGIGDIKTGGESLTKDQQNYRRLRDLIMDGEVKDDPKNKDYKAIMADEFLRQVYESVQEAGGKMTADDKSYIYPYEYWDKSSTLANAEENGWRYMEYCRRLGRGPKFSGKYSGEKWTADGDFTGEKGYWKTLIDRRMYDTEGRYQGMTPIDSNGFDTELIDIKAMREKYNETRVADDEGVNKIVETVKEKQADRTGTYEYPYGMGQAEAARQMKKAALTGKAKSAMVKKYNDAAKQYQKEQLEKSRAGKKFSLPETTVDEGEGSDAAPRFSIVRDPIERALIESELERDRRETGEYEVRYRAMLNMDDGLHQPMATKDRGKLREALHEGDIERSDEVDFSQVVTPEIQKQIDELDASNELGDVVIIPNKLRYHKGAEGGVYQFYLVKDNNKSSQWVAYNPYLHMSDTPLNDQFKSAWDRPNMVVVRVLIPRSELSVGEEGRALHAKDAPGNIPWNSGTVNGSLPEEQRRTVTLSRYCKIDKILSADEAVDLYVDKLLDNDVAVPFNCVTPAEREALYKRGVRIVEPQKNTGAKCQKAWEQWKSEHPGGPKGGVRISLSEEDQRLFDGAKRKFGETKDIREAGYVLPDGTMLDFSGRHEMNPGSDSSHLAGSRHTDHRAINQISFIYDENGDEVDTGVSSDMPDFIRRGAIRIDNNAGLINLSTKPTAGQRKVLRQLVAENGGTVDVDFGDGWDTDHSVYYDNTNATKVLGDIDRYFDEGIKPQSSPKFSLSPTFYSNAERAVEGVKQEKATAEQWKAMLTKAGGIKAGEDKWMGLSTWLDEHKGETLTRDEVLRFVRDNGIRMEEVNYYSDNSLRLTDSQRAKLDEFQKEFDEARPSDEPYSVADEAAMKVMVERHGEDFELGFWVDGDGKLQPVEDFSEGGMIDWIALRYLGQGGNEDGTNHINPTRIKYTTNGLENKREIAFVVPNVEPYQEGDEIHFGPENQGRAVMWVRFGETTDIDGNRVLVIDEVQSNRHQDAREKGYKATANTKGYNVEKDEHGNYIVTNKDGETRTFQYYEVHSENEAKLYAAKLDQGIFHADGIPAAPFEKNWHEVAMKRMLRLAAEEGFDKVAWTTGEQQADRYDISKIINSIDREDSVYDAKDRGFILRDRREGHTLYVDNDGIVTDSSIDAFNGKPLAEVVGKELADKMMKMEDGDSFDTKDLVVGGEGMKAFYDGMLPQFMNKYGKRWGVKVGEVTLDTPGGETMHSVDVTPEMRRSVMEQGQPLFSLSLGAPYQGSKGRIAKDVVDALPEGRRFVDLFAGGGAVTHAAMLSGKYGTYHMNDINPAGKDLFLQGMRGEWRDYSPREMIAEEFKAIKGTPEGLVLSYSGLGRNLNPDKAKIAQQVRRVQRLEQLKPYADKVQDSNTDYREVELQPGDVVYADIPYEGTNKTGYRKGAKFDKAAFSEWGLEQDVPIFVSEQSMPDGWTEIKAIDMPSMRGAKRTERLFVQSKFADQVRGETAQYSNTEGPRFQLSEDIEGWQSEQVSWERTALDHLLQNAARNEENKGIRSQAVKEVNRKLNDLFGRMAGDYDFDPSLDISRGTRAATTAQRKYDRWTVDELVSMAKSMLKSGMYDGLTPHQVNRLIGKINQGAGRAEIQEQMNTVFDVLMNANLNGWKEQLNKLMRIKPIRINDQGVRVMGQVDKNYATTLKTLKDALELTQEELADKIAEVSDRLASDNSNEAHNAANEMEGLILAQQYNDLIGKYDADNKGIKAEIRKQLEKIYDFWREPVVDEEGNIEYRKDGLMKTVEKRRLKPEYGGLDEDGNRVTPTEEAKAERKRIEGIVASLESKRRENQVQMSEGYAQLTDALGGGVAAAVTRAKEFREGEKQRKQEIYHAANSDLLGVDDNTETVDPSQQMSPANWSFVRGLLGPLATFDKMLRFFGQRSANGEGRLFNMFMRRQIDCGDAEWRSKKAGQDEMDAKTKELFGKKWMTMGNKMRDGKKFPPITLSYFDKVGKPRTIELRQDEAVYLYCVNKMRDGRMKLEAMGIDGDMVEQIVQRLDTRLVKLADWYQGEFLPKHRSRYNEVYERMFGTPMARIENYIHLNINKNETASNQEIGEPIDNQRGPTHVTGSIKERKTNVTPIELRTSIFDLAWSEHDKMEHWAAWGEYSRDLKDLINYRNFKAKVRNMKSVEFGNGKELLENFRRCAAIVTGDYDNPGRHAKIDRAATNLAKGVTSAKIGFRMFTALKQTLSFPAFFSDARPDDLLFAMGNAEGTIEWAMENLPGFSKRWQSRQAGDTRLMETDSDWKVWKNSAVKAIGRVSMLPNAAVDCLTVAIGARGVYRTAKRRYLSYGYTEAQAEKKALQDAAISYNASQQSSEGAFTSAQQVDRTLAGVATTVFRNASMGYERRFTQGIRNLKKMAFQKGYREEVIENTKKQMMEEGLTEEQAERAAERVYNRMKWHSMLDVVNFGFVLPFFWNLGPAMVYILTGNDDEEKKELIRDSALHALYGPIEGLSMGGTISELANIITGSMLMDEKSLKETMQGLRHRNFNPLPIVSDMQSLFNAFGTDTWSGVNDVFNLVVQMGTGVNPETATNMTWGIIDACQGDMDLSKKAAFAFLRFINAPSSQVDKLYMDELGITKDEASKMSWDELAKKYARYHAVKDATVVAPFLSDEAEEAREEKYVDKFYKRAAEQLEKADDEDLQRVYGQGDEQKKMVAKAKAKQEGLENEKYAKKPSANTKESTKKAYDAYSRKRSYSDMAEDILLQKAEKEAKDNGDESRAKAIQDVIDDIAGKVRGDEKKGIKGIGIDRKTDERLLKEIGETRAKALKELGITK